MCFKPRSKSLRALAEEGALDLIKERVKSNPKEVNKRDAYSQLGFTPLMGAARYGFAEICDVLLENGGKASLEERDNFGDNALLLACTFESRGQLDTVKVLLKHGADIEAKHLGKLAWTPLIAATQSGNIKIVETLLKAQANVNNTAVHDLTALMVAAKAGNEAMVRLLLEAGADPTLRDSENNTPAMMTTKKSIKDMLDEATDLATQSREEYEHEHEPSARYLKSNQASSTKGSPGRKATRDESSKTIERPFTPTLIKGQQQRYAYESLDTEYSYSTKSKASYSPEETQSQKRMEKKQYLRRKAEKEMILRQEEERARQLAEARKDAWGGMFWGSSR